MNGGPYASASASGWTAVWLPYGDGRLDMMALLPSAGRVGCALPTAAQLGSLTTRLAAGGTDQGSGPLLTRDISLPKVNLQDKVSMKSLLTDLGMGVAFTAAADFAGLWPGSPTRRSPSRAGNAGVWCAHAVSWPRKPGNGQGEAP